MIKVNKEITYHTPVLGEQICAYLLKKTDGVYYDGTLGGGGHAKMLLEKLSPSALYIAVDRDSDALEFSRRRLQESQNVVYVHATFDQIEFAMHEAGVSRLDVIFLDLGVSSHQIDNEQRGFAYKPHAPLDMRMDRDQSLTAETVLAEYPENELRRIFKEFGEERFSAKIARLVVQTRNSQHIHLAGDLIRIIDRCIGPQFRIKSYARIFQALRIEVNRELDILRETLEQSLQKLNPGGRIGILSYHSLEDRICKFFLRDQENPCTCPPEFPICVCNRKPQLKRIKPYLILPSKEEIKKNPRARSAKFRVGEKL